MKSSIPLSKASAQDLVVFDLDGTLAESKSAMDNEMKALFIELLNQKKVAVISGGKHGQFQKQILVPLKGTRARFENLFLFPTLSNAFYRYQGGWKKVYAKLLTPAQKTAIKKAFKIMFDEIGYEHPKKLYGPIIEDRGTQITYSALGQEIVTELGEKEGVRQKKAWADLNLRPKMMKTLEKYLPKGFVCQGGGLTSIDVVKKGIDKAYGMRQIEKTLKLPIKKMLFVGDAIFPGGNDYPATQTGVPYVKVKDPSDTKKLIRTIVGAR